MRVYTEMKEINFMCVQSIFSIVFKEFEFFFFLAVTANFRAVWAEFKTRR